MTENTTNNLNNLLQNVAIIQKKYEEIAKITGENFNVFSVLKMDSNEVKMHSAFLGELLNPNGSHGLKDEPLKIFLDLLNGKFNEIDSKENDNKFELDTKTVTTIVEKHIGITNEDKTEGGRIDIIVEDKNKKAIIIENKIYAIEQPNQLIRYNNYSKNAPILYLTLHGDAPTSHGELKQNIDYFNISYEKHIKEWLELCLKEAVEFPMLREVIKQYIYLIKKLTRQSTNNNMSKEIIKTILSSKENIKGALEIAGNINNLKQVICKDFFDQIKDKLKADFDFEDYKGNNNIGRKDSGIYFSKKENKDKKVLLWFGSEYNQLEIGVTDENNSWIEGGNNFESFTDTSWEDLLDSKEIDNAVNEIKQFFEKVYK